MLAARSAVPTVSSVRSNASWASLVAVAAGSFVLLLLGMSRELNIFDEGIIFSGGMRILAGELIHRDFYALYGPGQFYAAAAALKFSAHPFLAARLYDLAVRAAIVAAAFALLRTRVRLPLALLFTAASGAWLLAIGFHLYPIFPCILLAIIGSVGVARFGANEAGRTAIIGAGACTGGAALFRYDVGFFLVVAHALALLALVLLAPPRRRWLRQLVAGGLCYALGTSIVFLPFALAFLLASPVRPFLDDIVDFPLRYYAGMRSLPFPGLHDLLADPANISTYLPLLAGLLALAECVRQAIARRPALDPAAACLITLGLVAFVLFFKGVVRVSTIHMLLAIIPAVIATGLAAALWWRRGRATRVLSIALVALTLLPTLSALRVYAQITRGFPERSVGGWLAIKAGLLPAPPAPACDTGFVQVAPKYAAMASYLSVATGPDERILVAVGRHDKIFANPMALYFLANRLPSTHWSEFDPGLQTRADIQAAMIQELQRNHVRWVVRDTSFDNAREPNKSAISSGVTLLDSYLEAHYRPVAAAGPVSAWLLDGEPAPAVPTACGISVPQ